MIKRLCKAFKRELQFRLLLETLAEWLSKKEGIAKAFLTKHSDVLILVLIRDKCEYDEEFEDEVSEYDISISNDPRFDLLDLNMMVLPLISEENIASCINRDFCFEYRKGIFVYV